MSREIVSNTSPLISLEKLSNGFSFIRKLYDKIIVPPAVLDELRASDETPDAYLRRYQIQDLIEVQTPRIVPTVRKNSRLHEGEIQAISLAENKNLPILLEEREGRRVATSLNLQFSGIARQIANAYKKRLIDFPEAKRKLLFLLEANRINRKVYDTILSLIE